MVESFELESQSWKDNKLSFSFSFSTKNKCEAEDFHIVFTNDIAGNPKDFPFNCNISNGSQKIIKVSCDDYTFDESLTFDQMTNFSALRVINEKSGIEVNVPMYCGSEDGKSIVVELYSPM